MELLEDDGVIVIVVYPGHEQGQQESIEVENFVKTLPQKKYDVVKYQFLNQINNPPYVIVIESR